MNVADAQRQIDHAVDLIERLNHEKERHALCREAGLRRDEPGMQTNRKLEDDWGKTVQKLIEEVQCLLKDLHGPIRAYGPSQRRFRWSTFYDMVASGKDDYEKWKASGWPEVHIQELQAVRRALGNIEQKSNKLGQAGRITRTNESGSAAETINIRSPTVVMLDGNATINIDQRTEYTTPIASLRDAVAALPDESPTFAKVAKETAIDVIGSAVKDVAKGRVKEAAKQICEQGKDLGPVVANTATYTFFRSFLGY